MSAGAAVPTPRTPADGGSAAPAFGSVAVIGLGVMGGSLARALRSLAAAPEVIGFSPDPVERGAALAAGALDRAAETAEDAAAGAELVVYAAPLSAILELRARHRTAWRTDAVVSDLSSLQAPLAEQARALGFADRVVSAHPMVGGEGSGFAASRPGILDGATVWLSGDAPRGAAGRVEALWRALGGRPVWSDPREHDRRMVLASHLPQLVANALALALEAEGVARSDLGSGGRDTTRLAGSAPAMWRELLARSGPEAARALRSVGAEVEALAARLEAGDVEAVSALMERTRAWAAGGRAEPERGEP